VSGVVVGDDHDGAVGVVGDEFLGGQASDGPDGD